MPVGPQQVPQLQVSHNYAMWLLAAIKQEKIFLLDFDFIESFKNILNPYKRWGERGGHAIEFGKKFT